MSNIKREDSLCWRLQQSALRMVWFIADQKETCFQFTVLVGTFKCEFFTVMLFLPNSVLCKVNRELMCFVNAGFHALTLSHRSFRSAKKPKIIKNFLGVRFKCGVKSISFSESS